MNSIQERYLRCQKHTGTFNMCHNSWLLISLESLVDSLTCWQFAVLTLLKRFCIVLNIMHVHLFQTYKLKNTQIEFHFQQITCISFGCFLFFLFQIDVESLLKIFYQVFNVPWKNAIASLQFRDDVWNFRLSIAQSVIFLTSFPRTI